MASTTKPLAELAPVAASLTDSSLDASTGAARLRAAAIGLAALGAAALALLVYFDLGPPLAFNDDWMYAWAVQRLDAGHLALYPASSALALTQIGWATLVTFGHYDPRLLRLTVIPFVGLLGFSTFQVARRLGTAPFWSGVAGLVVTTSPFYLASATSFMSDIPYTALAMAAAWNGLRWQQEDRGKAWTVILVAAASAERQLGVFIAPALTLALWMAWRTRPQRLSRWIPVAVLWVAAAAAILVPHVLGLTPAAASGRQDQIAVKPVNALIDLLVVPGELGIVLIPFLVALLTVRYVRPLHDHRGPALIVLAGAVLLITFTHGGLPTTGDGFQPMGLMDVLAANPQTKVLLYPWPLYETVMALAIISFAAFAIWRWGAWRPVGPATLMLVALAAGQLVFWLVSPTFAYDRYYFAVAAPLVPLAAWVAGRSLRPQAAKAWALAALAVGLALYAVGEQDYQAWQVARDATARLAYQTASPEYVNAGYEANAVYWEVPYYDRTGIDVSAWSDPTKWDFAILGPRRPQLVLVFARADDPRPGFTYQSMSPGKIVIIVVAPPAR